MAAHTSSPDPYYRCELHCVHDLGRGMSVADLLGLGDGSTAPLSAPATLQFVPRPPMATVPDTFTARSHADAS